MSWYRENCPPYERFREMSEMARWLRAGCPFPLPHFIKRLTVLEYAKANNLRTFVETGTFRGTMVRHMIPHMDTIWSIEIDQVLHEQNVRKFKNEPKVNLVLGDSSVKLQEVVKKLTDPALFWLDGHYSGGVTGGEGQNPLENELKVLLSLKGQNVILIDDMQQDGIDDVLTPKRVEEIVRENSSTKIDFQIRNGIARLTTIAE